MAYEIADTSAAMARGFEMGAQLGDALAERAQRLQAEEVTQQVQAQLNELKAEGLTAHAEYEELLARMSAGDEEIDPKELARAGRTAVVKGMLYQQRSMEVVNQAILANPENAILQKNLGTMAAQIQQGAEQAMQIGKMLHEEGMAEEQAAEDKRRWDADFQQQEDHFSRSEERLQTNADREYRLQAADMAERRAERQESRGFRERAEARDERQLQMAEEEHAGKQKALRLEDTLALKDARDALLAKGADEDQVDSFFEAQGVDRATLDQLGEVDGTDAETEEMDEDDVGELKEIEKLIEHESSKKTPDKRKIKELRAEEAELKAKVGKKKDEEIDRRVKARQSEKHRAQVIEDFKAWSKENLQGAARAVGAVSQAGAELRAGGPVETEYASEE
jgi:hypothetical protein